MRDRHKTTVIDSDVLIVGGGMAGCFAAIKAAAAGAAVTVVDKGHLGKSGQTPFAGGMLVFNEEWGDDLDAWMEQIAVYGDHLNRRDWTELCLRESHARYEELVSWGVRFDRDAGGGLRRGGVPLGPCQAAHMGTRAPSLILRGRVKRSGARIVDRTMITGLLKSADAVVGAVGFSLDREEVLVLRAGAVVLAAGAGGLKVPGWPIGELTSDGDAMAYRAGATITGKEFVDPHASRADRDARSAFGTFGRDGDDGRPRFGPIFNAEGDEVPPTGTLFLSLEFEAHAGRAPLTMKLDGEDVPVVGGAASGMSVHKAEGVWPAGLDCSSGVPGLYAAGDALGTMQSGATYGAIGQSIANCAVTGARAGLAAAAHAQDAGGVAGVAGSSEVTERALQELLGPLQRRGGFSPRWATRVLQDTMLPYFVMYVKHGDRLQAALTTVEFLASHVCPMLRAGDAHELRLAHETRNMVLNAEMRLRASLFREESRGCHYREDFPYREDDWLAWVLLREDDGRMAVLKELIPGEWRPDPGTPYEERYPLRYPGE